MPASLRVAVINRFSYSEQYLYNINTRLTCLKIQSDVYQINLTLITLILRNVSCKRNNIPDAIGLSNYINI